MAGFRYSKQEKDRDRAHGIRWNTCNRETIRPKVFLLTVRVAARYLAPERMVEVVCGIIRGQKGAEDPATEKIGTVFR